MAADFAGNGELHDDDAPGPIELTIEATNAEGDLAAWFDDFWWTDVIERWGYEPVTIHLAPTPQALLHPVVLHQMEMVRRVAPRWRTVGHVYSHDVTSDDATESIACSPYHEIRFLDKERRGAVESERQGKALPIDELFGRIRREQSRLRTMRPVLVRIPSPATEPSVPAAVEAPTAEPSVSPA